MGRSPVGLSPIRASLCRDTPIWIALAHRSHPIPTNGPIKDSSAYRHSTTVLSRLLLDQPGMWVIEVLARNLTPRQYLRWGFESSHLGCSGTPSACTGRCKRL